LTGFLPTELGQLTLLHSLDLSENKFGGTLPTELNALSSLTTFAIHQTKGRITGNLPAFDVFPNLKLLNLASNGFKGSIPDTFLAGIAEKGSDIIVELGMNQLTGTIPKSLNVFDRLDISLEGNLIEE
jgi:LRR receptor-like serine/threonine-protein kinase ERECTA